MRIIAIIPARGGSKGIPRKNLQDICGNSLVGRKIDQARQSKCTEVWVSTDDSEITQESIRNGAEIICRPDELSTDESSTDDLLVHAMDVLQCADDDIIVLLQPTSPLLELSSLDACIERLIENSTLNSVITVKEGHPFMWGSKNGTLWNPEGHTRIHRPRRQELGFSGWETGGCYAIRVKSLREQQVRYPEPTSIVGVTYVESIDIDSYEDLEVARQILSLKLSTSTKGNAPE